MKVKCSSSIHTIGVTFWSGKMDKLIYMQLKHKHKIKRISKMVNRNNIIHLGPKLISEYLHYLFITKTLLQVSISRNPWLSFLTMVDKPTLHLVKPRNQWLSLMAQHWLNKFNIRLNHTLNLYWFCFWSSSKFTCCFFFNNDCNVKNRYFFRRHIRKGKSLNLSLPWYQTIVLSYILNHYVCELFFSALCFAPMYCNYKSIVIIVSIL